MANYLITYISNGIEYNVEADYYSVKEVIDSSDYATTHKLLSMQTIIRKVKYNQELGGMIGAIKIVREVMSWGLKESKDYVDTL